MKKTVVSHFYNEEHLLPWWLNHHKQIFDHGIMIDYHSTDRSMEIIREICPDWELKYTRNKYFDSTPIDQEVMDIEKKLEGWRMCLNTTEFLYGNISHLDDRQEPTQYFIGNYVFVDMEDEIKGPLTLSHDVPLHEQRYWGYNEIDPPSGGCRSQGSMARFNRSIHTYPVKYDGGRHYPKTQRSFDDLVIFYYGWADVSASGIKRKIQIKDKVSDEEKNRGIHRHAEDVILDQYRKDQQPISKNLKDIVDGIYEAQKNSTVKQKTSTPIEQPIQNVTELAITYEGTVVEISATDSKLIQAEPRVVG